MSWDSSIPNACESQSRGGMISVKLGSDIAQISSFQEKEFEETKQSPPGLERGKEISQIINITVKERDLSRAVIRYMQLGISLKIQENPGDEYIQAEKAITKRLLYIQEDPISQDMQQGIAVGPTFWHGVLLQALQINWPGAPKKHILIDCLLRALPIMKEHHQHRTNEITEYFRGTVPEIWDKFQGKSGEAFAQLYGLEEE